LKNLRIDLKLHQEVIKSSDYDPFKLSLILRKYTPEDRSYIVNQVNARQKAKIKIPEFYTQEKVVYPSLLSVEQASSSSTARYKAELVKDGTLIDMTGGLGVDSFFFSQSVSKVLYIEKDKDIAEIALYNFRVLNARNIEIINDDSLNYIKNISDKFNYIYLDPSRRFEDRRVFKLEDSVPNVMEIVPILLEKAEKIIIKVSPLIDITYILHHFKHLFQVHIVAVNQECKEILILLDDKKYTQDTDIVTWSKEVNRTHSFISNMKENEEECDYSAPLRYIYDPNVSLRKSGLFNAVGKRFHLKKLAPNSHLYTNNELNTLFPGRIFKILDVKQWKDLVKDKTIRKANIATRNFRLKVKEIRQKTGICEGGDTYIFCTTDLDNKKKILVTEKVNC